MTSGAEQSAKVVILNFLKNKKGSHDLYQKLCSSFLSIEQWSSETMESFVLEFINLSSILDQRCSDLVKKFTDINWTTIPLGSRDNFVNFLRDVAIQHICHTESLLECFIVQFIPRVKPVTVSDTQDQTVDEKSGNESFTLAVSASEQRAAYELAHNSILYITNCYPMAFKCIKHIISRVFPHYSAYSLRYVEFVKNVFVMMEYCRDICDDLFVILIDRFTQIDAIVSANSETVFCMKEVDCNDGYFNDDRTILPGIVTEVEQCSSNAKNVERSIKLDTCLVYTFAYISKSFKMKLPPDVVIDDAVWLENVKGSNRIWSDMSKSFVDHVLLSYRVKSVPYLWLYVCSLDNECSERFQNSLWRIITEPRPGINDYLKAHGAACFLGSFLSRANFVDIRVCFDWMHRLIKWCLSYLAHVSSRQLGIAPGDFCHGKFYAMCQALLVTFCYRYPEVIRINKFNEVRHWGFGRLVNSALEPLRYIDRRIALYFVSISRSLQLVYCHHIFPFQTTSDKIPFEPNFPFDHYFLKRSSSFVKPIVCWFSPLSDDRICLESDISRFRRPRGDSESMDFLEDIDRDAELFDDYDEDSVEKSSHSFEWSSLQHA